MYVKTNFIITLYNLLMYACWEFKTNNNFS